MRKTVATYIALLITMGSASGQNDTINCRSRIASTHTFRQETIETNAMPSVIYDHRGYTLRDVSLRASKTNKGIYLQRGNGGKDIDFNANAYVRRKDGVLWGEAQYANKTTYDIIWNESSDIDKIYPFLTADSVGGDIKSEKYAINGGYAKRLGCWTIGGELLYNAKIEIREVDPRPKNITSELKIKVGASWGEDMLSDISIEGERYKQTGEIERLNETTSAKIYHLIGMGRHYVRFVGQADDTYYDGHGIGASIGVHQRQNNGLNVKIAAGYNTFDKILTGSLYNDAPICTLKETSLCAQANYLAEQWGVSIDGKRAYRKGIVNIFGEAINNSYKKISENDGYELETRTLEVRGHYEKATWGIKPRVAITFEEEQYADPYQYMKTSGIEKGIELYKHIDLAKSTIRMAGQFNHRSTSDNTLDMEVEKSQNTLLAELTESRFWSKTSDVASYGAEAEVMYEISRSYTLSLEAKWCNSTYVDLDTTVSDISIALHFYF